MSSPTVGISSDGATRMNACGGGYHYAEETYLKSEAQDAIMGLDTLLARLHRLRQMSDVTRLSLKIFDLYVDLASVEGFLRSYERLFAIDDVLEPDTLNSIIDKALEVHAKLLPSDEEAARFANITGLLLAALAGKSSDGQDREQYLTRAMEHYEQGLTLESRSSLRCAVYANLAVSKGQLGADQEALRYINDAMSLSTDDKDIGRAITLSNAATIYWRAGQTEQVAELIDAAHQVYREVIDHWDQKFTLNYQFVTSDDIFHFRYAKMAYANFLKSFGLASKAEIDKIKQEADGLQVSDPNSGFRYLDVPYDFVNSGEFGDWNIRL